MKHPLINRTSPKGPGTHFIGTCAACGKTGLTHKDIATEECPNQRGMTQESALIEAIEADPPQPSTPWPDPTPEMLERADFNAVWNVIKAWNINVPYAYEGYCGATGNHVRAIIDALALPTADHDAMREALKEAITFMTGEIDYRLTLYLPSSDPDDADEDWKKFGKPMEILRIKLTAALALIGEG